MKSTRSAAAYIPSHPDLPLLQEASKHCQGCDLYLHATQTVFGEGRSHPALMLVGEQPGDQEDRAGKPFVGPAGKLLDRALQDAGIDREKVYVTNAVKHFRFEERGKRRIHQKPLVSQVHACLPWLEAEFQVVQPRGIVCLGATSAQALLGSTFRISTQRGVWLQHMALGPVLATIHPSALLRMLDPQEREREYTRFVDDLKFAATVRRHR